MQGNTSQEQKTTPKQDAFIQSLLAGNNIVTSAKIAGCNEKTGHAWLKLPHVQKTYQEAKQQVMDFALGKLALGAEKAISRIEKLIDDPDAPASVQLRAAQIYLEQSIAIHKVSELEAKIAELEELVKERLG